jgi:rhamnose utilization protein RhaD (predicted bifunctional aldolase and dehydrogenase)/NAD(P)-dependent dehydrogenase (short-subunit alcohol dehydrogenase family)
MQSAWQGEEAAKYPGDLGQLVYASRLLGKDRALVLHGGGNTSVKLTEKNIFGELEDMLFVKGSGTDLATVDSRSFTPLRLKPLARLLTLSALSDQQWADELGSNILHADAPPPSVETLLHALLPHKFVLHTHPDAVLAIASTPNGADRLREIYGDLVVIVPYARSGFPIAKLCAETFAAQAGRSTIGIFLMNHGLLTFGETARESNERTIDLVNRAGEYLQARNAWTISLPPAAATQRELRKDLAVLRQEISDIAGFPVVMSLHDDSPSLGFARREDVAQISQQGPATPDHAIRTKNKPLVGANNLQAYRAAYETYFRAHAPRVEGSPLMLDPAPRVILDPDYGMLAIGRSASAAGISADIYRNTMDIILRATALGGYQALPEEEIFALEYWTAEQAKLHTGQQKLFAGEIALVTGAGGGIGKACAEAFLDRGAAVVGLDINPEITRLFDRPDFLGIECDMTDEDAVREALETTVRRFGGLDMLVPNAGIFPSGCRIDSLSSAEWRKVMAINVDANLALMREAYPLLKASPRRGRMVVVSSRNVPAPGPGAVAYSASKAALTQMARVAALEWGKDGIRVNLVNPHAVFDTGIWTEEVLKSRAANYGLSVDEYKKNNVLKVEVTSRDVGNLVAEMCGPLFAKTTGAQVPIDGGSDRVI